MPKPLLGPPEPHRYLVAARTALETSVDPVEVVMAALALRDLGGMVPTGGGFAGMNDRARAYATDVVDALTMRGLLPAQDVLRL